MRSVFKKGLLVFGALGASTFASRARAQVDVNPPLPNVMILLDTSGSMENMLDGNTPESENAQCALTATLVRPTRSTVADPTKLANGSSPNRWGIAMQALTGSMSPAYSCVSMPRSSGSYFDQEYAIDTKSAYDVNYYLPYHRPFIGTTTAGACVVSPGVLPGDPSGGVGNAAARNRWARDRLQRELDHDASCSAASRAPARSRNTKTASSTPRAISFASA